MTALATITFGQPAPLLNMNTPAKTRAAAIGRSRQIALWRWTAAQAALQTGVGPSARALPPSFVHVELPVPDRRRRDPSNYMATTKPIVDGLVDAGLWPDDNPQFVTQLEPTLVLVPRVAGRVPEVTVRVYDRAVGFPAEVLTGTAADVSPSHPLENPS